MKKGIFDRRIPTVFAIFILLGGLAITTLLIQQGTFTTSKASPQEEPQDVRIVNVTNNSFTVMFTTNTPTVGAVSIENTTPPRLFYDKRDSSGQKAFVSHFVTVTDLDPKTNYAFNVISNGDLYLNQGKAFSVTTAPEISEKIADTFPLAGSILLPDASPGSDVLVFIDIPEGETAGAITDSQGNFRVSANYLRNKTTFEPLLLAQNTEIKIDAKKPNANSQISYSYQPGIIIPPITLSQNYTFTASEETQQPGDITSLLAIPTTSNTSSRLAITSPYRGQRLTDSRPQFRGTTTPSSIVRIVISDMQDIEAQVRSDRNGNWAFRPSTIVLPGEHVINVQSTSTSGAAQNASSDFEILPSGSQIAESATPSATLIPIRTATPTKTITPIPTVTLINASPTGILSLTPTIASTTPTLVVSITLTPTPPRIVVTSAIPPKATIPPTGNSTTTIILTTLSILFIVTGSAFLFIL